MGILLFHYRYEGASASGAKTLFKCALASMTGGAITLTDVTPGLSALTTRARMMKLALASMESTTLAWYWYEGSSSSRKFVLLKVTEAMTDGQTPYGINITKPAPGETENNCIGIVVNNSTTKVWRGRNNGKISEYSFTVPTTGKTTATFVKEWSSPNATMGFGFLDPGAGDIYRSARSPTR